MRKALGQFFTPDAVAELASAFVYSLITPADVLDPMSGTGILLQAIDCEAQRLQRTPARLHGIELDPDLVSRARQTVAGANLINADAFAALAFFPPVDAVIGNPPYVRYQSLGEIAELLQLPEPSKDSNPNTRVAEEVRQRVLRLGSGNSPLITAWRELVSLYPTRADVSTPAWLAMWPKLKESGVFAFIVPKTWDTRDYGLLLEYYLLRFFDLRAIAHIGAELSFSGAQVATDLIIAQKRSIDRLPGGILREGFSGLDYREFWVTDARAASALADALRARSVSYEVKTRESSLEEMRQRLLSRLGSARKNISRALRRIDGHADTDTQIGTAPSSWVASVIGAADWISAEDQGIKINQGLRTGCNDFFYARILGSSRRDGYLQAEIPILRDLGVRDSTVELPARFLRSCVRYSQDLPRFITSQHDELPWRVIVIAGRTSSGQMPEIPSEFLSAIRLAETKPVQVKGRLALIPDLSALKGNGSGRAWYCLDVRPRHGGDLFVSRINDGMVVTYLNTDRFQLVDANFSTISLPKDIDRWAMLAFMNSTPARLLIEGLGTPMGGGALKVEAAQLRRLALPNSGDHCWQNLSECGELLSLLPGKVIPADLQERIDSSLVSSGAKEKFSLSRLSERLQAIVRWRRNRGALPDPSSNLVPSICAELQSI